jgi:starvation-inducible outer membrane lipoprotein
MSKLSVVLLSVILSSCATVPQGIGTTADAMCATHGGTAMVLDDSHQQESLFGKGIICADRTLYRFNAGTGKFEQEDL